MSDKNQDQMTECNTFENLTRFREPLIDTILNLLDIKPGYKGIDICCGIGSIIKMIGNKTGCEGKILGLDF